MKRLLTILILSLVVMMAQAGIKTVTFAGLKYAVDTDRQVAQLIQQEVKIKGDLVIPDAIKYKDKASGKYIHCPVVSIAPYALAGQKGIKSLYIPASMPLLTARNSVMRVLVALWVSVPTTKTGSLAPRNWKSTPSSCLASP